MNPNKYFFAALSSFFIWGFFGLTLRFMSAFSPVDILFYRVFSATILLVLINFLFRKKIVQNDFLSFKKLSISERKKSTFLTIVGGIILIINWYLFMYAVNHVSMKSASFAYLICPIITTVLAFFILKEKLNNWQWFSVLLFAVSCVILSFGSIRDLIYSLIIATTWAFYLISQRKNNKFDKFLILTIQLIIGSIILMPFYPKFCGSFPSEIIFYELLFLVVVLFTIIPLYLNLFALKGINSATVGVLMYTNPLINFLLSVFYFKETVSNTQIISYSIILISILIFNERFFRKLK